MLAVLRSDLLEHIKRLNPSVYTRIICTNFNKYIKRNNVNIVWCGVYIIHQLEHGSIECLSPQ